jgi:hypothetical protein
MVTPPQTADDAVSTSKASLLEAAKRNAVLIISAALLSGFGAGIGSYRGLLEITNQETVIKNSCIPKDKLIGPILKDEAVSKIESMIETGQSVGNDEAKARVWLMEVLAFIHGLSLDKDYMWQGQRMSAIEADIRFALTDQSLEAQAEKTLGILKGFRAALQTRVSK